MRTLIILILGSLLSLPMVQGQNPFLKKLERKAKQRMERKIDQKTDEGLDAVEEALDPKAKGKKKKKAKAEEAAVEESASASDAAMAGEASQTQQTQSEEQNPETEPVITQTPRKKAENKPKEILPFPEESFGPATAAEQGIAGKGPFGLSSGLLITRTTVVHPNMTQTQFDTLYFDQFGNRQKRYQRSIQEVDMMGMKNKQVNHIHAWTLGDSVFSVKPGERTGFAMVNPAQALYREMSEAEIKRFAESLAQDMDMTVTTRGSQVLEGKTCLVMDAVSHDQQGRVSMRVRTWAWKGHILRYLARGPDLQMETELLLLDEHSPVPSRHFQKRNDVTYRSLSWGN